MRRSAVSIASNIAEGHARKTQRELYRFLNMAKGSLAELETQLTIAGELGFADASQLSKLVGLADQESRMLSGLLKSVSETI
jgi:four helix bundle protein